MTKIFRDFVLALIALSVGFVALYIALETFAGVALPDAGLGVFFGAVAWAAHRFVARGGKPVSGGFAWRAGLVMTLASMAIGGALFWLIGGLQSVGGESQLRSQIGLLLFVTILHWIAARYIFSIFVKSFAKNRRGA